MGGWKRSDGYGPLFDPEAVNNLAAVIEAVPEAIIVINSNWKIEGLARMRELWKARNLPGKIHSVTPDCTPDLMSIDLEDFDNIAMLSGKGNDVKAWIERHTTDGCSYVIFDDMPGFLPEQKKHLICTNPYTGITAKDAAKAIKILMES